MKTKGFTLIELIIVMIIITALMSYSIPHFSNVRKKKACSMANKTLIAACRTARSFAITTRKDHYLVFAPEGADDERNLAGHAFKLVMNKGTGAVPDYETVDDWMYLPRLVMFAEVGANTINIGYPEDTDLVQALPCIKFNKVSGKAQTVNIKVKIRTFIYDKFVRVEGSIIEESI